MEKYLSQIKLLQKLEMIIIILKRIWNLMKIKDIEIRMCRHKEPVMKDSEMRDGKKSDLEFLVITFHTDEGLSSSTFGFAGGAEMAGEIANSIFKPFFIGRDPLYREQHWHEYRTADRWWNHAPIYSYGPFDINCWLIIFNAS